MIKITCPDVDSFALVSKLLAKQQASVSATNNQLLFHIVNSRLKPKVVDQILDLEAEIEEL